MSNECQVVMQPLAGTSVPAITIQNNVEYLKVAPENRQMVMSLALATVLAKLLPVPTMPVEGVFSYYRDNNELLVRSLISKFNEVFLINIQDVSSFTYALWSLRYTALHPLAILAPNSCSTFFETLMGVNVFVDEKTYKVAIQNQVAVLSLTNHLGPLFTVEALSEANA